MQKENKVYTYVCDVCGRERDTEIENEICMRDHSVFVAGMYLLVYNRYKCYTYPAKVIEVDHKNLACLVEFNNKEREWKDFYSLRIRNGDIFPALPKNKIPGISGIGN